MKRQVTVGVWGLKPPHLFCKFLFLLFLVITSLQAQAQSGTVTGKVLDDKGEPIIGATIEVIDAFKKNIGGTVTDMDGNYSIDVKDINLSQLKISYLGNKTQTINIKGQTVIDVKLAEDADVLQEVVAVGYGNKTKPRVTEAISSISNEEMKITNNVTIENAMQGKASGVQVTQNSGSPGSASSVRIRGIGSTNGGEPLYVVDGVPLDGVAGLNLLNPNDIQTIDILKDASAAAIYGTRGSNGVVMITTKRGKAGKTQVNFESSVGVSNVWKKLDLLNNTQYVDYMKSLYPDNTFYNNPNNPALQNNTNWQDQAFRQALMQNYNLGISGGSDIATYSVSGGYFKQEGTILSTDFDRYSLRVNSDIKAKKWLKFGESMTISRTTESPLVLSLRDVVSAPPIMTVRDEAGGFSQVNSESTGVYDFTNPIAYNASVTNKNLAFRMLGNVFAEATILKKLKYRASVGMDIFNGRNTSVRLPFTSGTRSAVQGRDNPTRSFSDNRAFRYSPLLENTLLFTDTIAKKHEVSVLVGASQQYFFSSEANTVNPNTPVNTTSFAARGVVSGGSDNDFALRGYLGRVSYTYANKYMITANARYDGSSKFPAKQRYAFFPSFSVGWRLMEEKFFKNIGFVNNYVSDAKLRFGWGQTGNQEGLDNQVRYSLYNDKVKYPGVGGGVNVIAPATTQNTNIRWETVTTSNFGLDLSFLQNRLSLVTDYFVRQSDNMIIEIPIPYLAGFGPEGDETPRYWGNAGSLVNKGIEMALTFRKESKDINNLGYSFTANFSKIDNKITKLGDNNDPLFSSPTISQVNGPVGAYFGYQTDGIIQNANDVNYLVGTYKPVAGDVKFVDQNNDNIINDKDRVIIGNPIPKFVYGFSANLDWYGFDFKLFFQGVQGNSLYNELRSGLESMTSVGPQGGNQLATVADRWTAGDPSNDLPRAVNSVEAQNNAISSRWVESGSFLRLKTLQLVYTVPQVFLKRMTKTEDGVSLRIFVSAYNLLTFTKYTGFDPEVGSVNKVGTQTPDPLRTGVDNGTYPQPRTFSGGLQLTF